MLGAKSVDWVVDGRVVVTPTDLERMTVSGDDESGAVFVRANLSKRM